MPVCAVTSHSKSDSGSPGGKVEWADVVVATCDDACPVIPGKRYISWQLPDPKQEPLERVREIRDEIARLVDELVAQVDESTVAA